jgi:hypothetical protein
LSQRAATMRRNGHLAHGVTERHDSFMRREDVASKMLAVMEPAADRGSRSGKDRTTRGRKKTQKGRGRAATAATV